LVSKQLRAARLSTFSFFALNGFVLGMWLVHIPLIEHRTGTSHAVLGGLLLLLGGGAFIGMRVVGPLTDRFGARRIVPTSAALCSAALILPGLATNSWTLAVALLVLGLGNGCLDISMNTHAVAVEAAYGRPVMSAFHAMYSVGGVLAALVGARTLSWGWNPAVTFTEVSVLGIVVALIAGRALLTNRSPDASATAPTRKQRKQKVPAHIWALAALAVVLMLSEGVANDWSALHLRTILNAPEATAAFAYGVFSTAMTIGRLLVDRVASRVGPVAIVRYGASLAALGLTTVALSHWIPLVLVGWTLCGIGLSGCVPQLFSAAGHTDPAAAGANVSRVAGLGYLGVLAGPAIIGPLTHFIPLNLTFFLPVIFCLIAASAAQIVRSRTTPARTVNPR
jgi:MFS family permease